MGRRQLALRNIVKITGGAYHTLYINAQGELYTFGCNNCGQLGLGDIESHLNGPERVMKFVDGSEGPVQDLPPIVDIAAGESHSLALARYVVLLVFYCLEPSHVGTVAFLHLVPIWRDNWGSRFM